VLVLLHPQPRTRQRPPEPQRQGTGGADALATALFGDGEVSLVRATHVAIRLTAAETNADLDTLEPWLQSSSPTPARWMWTVLLDPFHADDARLEGLGRSGASGCLGNAALVSLTSSSRDDPRRLRWLQTPDPARQPAMS